MNNIFDPEDEDYGRLAEKLGQAYLKGQRRIEGKDYAIGDRLPDIFVKAGLHEIRAEVQADPWLTCDARRKLEDVKDEIRFELQTFRETNKLERKLMLAGGAKSGEITTLVRKSE